MVLIKFYQEVLLYILNEYINGKWTLIECIKEKWKCIVTQALIKVQIKIQKNLHYLIFEHCSMVFFFIEYNDAISC